MTCIYIVEVIINLSDWSAKCHDWLPIYAYCILAPYNICLDAKSSDLTKKN